MLENLTGSELGLGVSRSVDCGLSNYTICAKVRLHIGGRNCELKAGINAGREQSGRNTEALGAGSSILEKTILFGEKPER